MKLLILFIVLNIANVIIQTVKSIATIKCGKVVASIVNAIAYGLYTIVVVYTVCDLNLWVKVAVVALANLIGVYVVKLIEEKTKKDKLWKIEMAVPAEIATKVHNALNATGVPFNRLSVAPWTMFNCYCATQADTKMVTEIAKHFGAKLSAYEAQTII